MCCTKVAWDINLLSKIISKAGHSVSLKTLNYVLVVKLDALFIILDFKSFSPGSGLSLHTKIYRNN
jgi:hypothetical protein